MFTVTDIKSIDSVRCRCQRLNSLLSKVGHHKPLIPTGSVLQKGNSARVREPTPIIADASAVLSFFARTGQHPYRCWRVRLLGMLHKIIDILGAEKPKRVLNNV